MRISTTQAIQVIGALQTIRGRHRVAPKPAGFVKSMTVADVKINMMKACCVYVRGLCRDLHSCGILHGFNITGVLGHSGTCEITLEDGWWADILSWGGPTGLPSVIQAQQEI